MKEAQGHQVKPSWAQGLQGPRLLYRCDRLVVETVLLVEIPLTPLPSAKPLPEPRPKLLPRPNPEQFPNPPPMPPALTPPPTTAAGETKDMVIPSLPATRSLSPKLGERMATAGAEATYRWSGYSGILQTFCGEQKEQCVTAQPQALLCSMRRSQAPSPALGGQI